MSEQEWRWIPVSEPPGEDPRKICVLKDGEKDVYWWTDILGFEENITHWCELTFPPLPEPEKPLLQIVWEWRFPCVQFYPPETATQRRSMLWDIGTEIEKRYPGFFTQPSSDGNWIAYVPKTESNGLYICHGESRGEALLKAALWLMEQEGNDE